MQTRYASLDVIRGFAMFGVLAINAPYFAAPLETVANPLVGPLAQGPASTEIWSVAYVLFEYKSVAIFSMLFGASLCLVGGIGHSPLGSKKVNRRLWWLAFFGLLHGALFWFGDILLSYALVGLAVMHARTWSVRLLALWSAALFVGSMLILIGSATLIVPQQPADLAKIVEQSWNPDSQQIASTTARYRTGFGASMLANIQDWLTFQTQAFLLLSVRTAALMLAGMALFKSGFLIGRSAVRSYFAAMAFGVAALLVLVWNAQAMQLSGFDYQRSQIVGTVITAALAPIVAIGYCAAFVQLVSAGLAKGLTITFAAIGRLAFTSYLMQSLLLSAIFWSGRGLGLHGEVSRAELSAIIILIFAFQIVFARTWIARVGVGPFERVWRRLAYVADVARNTSSEDAHPALRTTGLSKHYGAVQAVRSLDLEVPKGAVFAFLGPNGSGKTTTLRMILGLVNPTAGEVKIFGADVVHAREQALGQVGALLEARSTYDQLNGRTNLDMTRMLLDLPASEVDRVLELVHLRHAADRRVGQYSLGMRQRLGLARALLGKPRLLILDEPMNGLDPEGIVQMREIISQLPEHEDVTVLLSTHLLDEAEQVASHIGLIRKGALVVQGELATILAAIPSRIEIATSDDNAARQLLASKGIPAVPRGDRIDVTAARIGPGAIASLIVGSGLGLHRLTPRRPDLEEFYHHWSKREVA